MATYAYDLIAELSKKYDDTITFNDAGGAGAYAVTTDGTRITAAEWVDILNEACRQIVLVRPDSNVEIASVQTVAGPKQTIPSDSQVLIDVLYNMGTDGTTRGTPVRFTDRDIFDLLDADWQTETPGDAITIHYTYDKRFPRTYFIYPKAVVGSLPYLEIVTSKVPTAMTTINSLFPIDNLFINAIKDWALYLAYSIDTDSKMNQQLAQWYYNAFYQELNIEVQAGALMAPSELELGE